MSNVTKEVVPKPETEAAAAATADVQPITPEELIETVRTLHARIPDFGPMSIADARSARAVANLRAQFKTAAIAAVGASEIVQTAVGLSAEELYKLNDEAERWTVAADELKALAHGVISANLKRRHRVGLASLQSYLITKQLVRNADHAILLPHFYEMKQNSRLGKRRRDRTSPEPRPDAPGAPASAPS